MTNNSLSIPTQRQMIGAASFQGTPAFLDLATQAMAILQHADKPLHDAINTARITYVETFEPIDICLSRKNHEYAVPEWAMQMGLPGVLASIVTGGFIDAAYLRAKLSKRSLTPSPSVAGVEGATGRLKTKHLSPQAIPRLQQYLVSLRQ